MFEAIVNRRIDLEGLEFQIQVADVETLNQAAFAGAAEITKLSYHAYAYCAVHYEVLDAGSALGRNCGPLLVSKRRISNEELIKAKLRVAIPGKFTTANLLLSLAVPEQTEKTAICFSEIESALMADRYDAGLIIHESRFTYEANGLKKILDLGEYWEKETGAPLPLGGIVISRSLSEAVKQKVERVVRRSVKYALTHPRTSREFVLSYANEINEEVVSRHIDLYVNSYSIELGDEGRNAVEMLFEKARTRGIICDSNVDFVRKKSSPLVG
jgi:1,4-dihydroxy-6-naphthoate synthase